MRAYQQLTHEQRYHIYAGRQVGKSQKEIASSIGVHKSTISRELRRNRGKNGYRASQAQEMAEARRKTARKRIKLTPEVVRKIEGNLRSDWSPEQISGYFAKRGEMTISHERIYQHVWADKRQGGTLWCHLRQSHKKRRKRYGKKDRRGIIPNRISIDHRPAVVDDKSRIGDWEIDLVMGRNHQGAIVSIVERVSKYTVLGRVKNKTEQAVTIATIEMLKAYRDLVHTITADNGKEFSGHERIKDALNAKVYFAHPYHSWERGLNENTNGLVRQYFPKTKDFRTISDEQVHEVMKKLNTRPRKTLRFETPEERFSGGRGHSP